MENTGKSFRPTPQQFIDFTHKSTERMAIYVIVDNYTEIEKIKGLKRMKNFYLTQDLNSEKERILKYYGNAPLWNLHVDFSTWCGHTSGAKYNYSGLGYVLVANVHFSDILEGFLREKAEKGVSMSFALQRPHLEEE